MDMVNIGLFMDGEWWTMVAPCGTSKCLMMVPNGGELPKRNEPSCTANMPFNKYEELMVPGSENDQLEGLQAARRCNPRVKCHKAGASGACARSNPDSRRLQGPAQAGRINCTRHGVYPGCLMLANSSVQDAATRRRPLVGQWLITAPHVHL